MIATAALLAGRGHSHRTSRPRRIAIRRSDADLPRRGLLLHPRGGGARGRWADGGAWQLLHRRPVRPGPGRVDRRRADARGGGHPAHRAGRGHVRGGRSSYAGPRFVLRSGGSRSRHRDPGPRGLRSPEPAEPDQPQRSSPGHRTRCARLGGDPGRRGRCLPGRTGGPRRVCGRDGPGAGPCAVRAGGRGADRAGTTGRAAALPDRDVAAGGSVPDLVPGGHPAGLRP